MDEAANPVPATGGDHVGDAVAIDGGHGLEAARGDRDDAGDVDHGIHAIERIGDGGCVPHVGPANLDSVGKIGGRTIPENQRPRLVAGGDQGRDQIGPDVAVGAGDGDLHHQTPGISARRSGG